VKLYEAMFLVDSSRAASDWDGLLSEIRKILERAGAEILSLKKWDERQLAYRVKRHTRGTYILSYFRADGSGVTDIERDVYLSEPILRVLILAAEGRQQDVDKETPVTLEQKKQQEARQAEASERHEQPVSAPAETKQEAEAARAPDEPKEQPAGEGEPQEISQAESEQDKDDSEKQNEDDKESESGVQAENEQDKASG